MTVKQWTLGELADAINGTVRGDPTVVITAVGTLKNAGPQQVSFLANSKYRQYLQSTRAAAVIVDEQAADSFTGNALVVDDPYVSYARLAGLLYPQQSRDSGCHPSAVIDPSADVHPSALVGANVSIGADVTISAGAEIGPGCVLMTGVHIGERSRLLANVTLGEKVSLGSRVIVHPGAVIGADGFGIAYDGEQWIKVPQVGSVEIGDDVEIGANTTIDRGAIDNTIIEQGVKLDNQIQIAHNCIIGAHTVIAGCAGIAGSTRIGRNCAIGGGAAIGGHLQITDGVQLTGMTMVTKSITQPGIYSSGIPAEPNRQWHRNIVRYRQMDKLAERVKTLEKSHQSK